LQHLRPAQNGIQGRAQLVRQRRQEFVFQAIGLFRLRSRFTLASQQPFAFVFSPFFFENIVK
jgi:hypothetical protein